MPSIPPFDERVLIRAPVGADAVNTSRVLQLAGFATHTCASLDETAHELKMDGAGALLLTEEAVNNSDVAALRTVLDHQPKWSDLPVILITSGGQTTVASTNAVNLLGHNCSLTLVERPVRTVTLVSALNSALRSRRRQYEVRNLILERDALLASLEQRVEERTAKLQQIVEELEAFSYSVSHDLRAPLRALDAYAQALLEDCGPQLSPDARGYAEKISRSAQRMDHLTQDLLTYTRVSRHNVSLKRVELETVVNDVIQNYPSITPSAARISVQRPLPAVLGHAPSLMQCFSNLFENALKFRREGEAPQITVEARTEGARVRVSVTDNGIGIDPAHHDRIFGIFERVMSTAEGTGIGLAIVRRAVERMGGTVGVESQLGHGARFWMDLAVAPPDELASPGRAPAASRRQGAGPDRLLFSLPSSLAGVG